MTDKIAAEIAELTKELEDLGAKRETNMSSIKKMGQDKETALSVARKVGRQMKEISQENKAIDARAQEAVGRLDTLKKAIAPAEESAVA